MDDRDVADGVAHLRLVSSSSVRASPPRSLNGDDDFEEDEVENEPSVLVGFLEKPQHPWSLSRHLFPSKAGGTPAWLDPVNLPQGKEISCGICGKPLQFLLQVYAAIDGREDAFHRTLFIFMCPDMSCLRQDKENQRESIQEKSCRSVKVFRCQLRRINEFYCKDPPNNNGLDGPIGKAAPLCSWCGTWKGEKICGACKKAGYCSRHHQLEHWKSGHAADCKAVASTPIEKPEDKVSKAESKPSMEQVDANHPACNKLWPEFEIVDEEEGSDEESAPSGNMALIGSGREDEISRQFQEVEPSLEQQHWASFQARISRAPGQVLRYCRSNDAKPLWARLDERPATTNIPHCPNCKERRIFEFQVLPQLLYYFRVSNDPDALDWGTLAIYTCEASCTSSKAYIEEFVWVQSA
ncbi:hypothetical protein GOP47_0011581 [Adiantum capillus-veneris]|uniref:MYND-type domain-containing protein n=1 Tax=Adiantum capillus-veneris TaxID=13818 RepID=A0A9D4ZFJ3_ADICA|nr:hypothetical protein GOP47_0011581 [Adiantum capillus-veneris]